MHVQTDVMTLALLQPLFAPNLYDLAVMMRADLVVLQDLERWSRKGRVHRAAIRTPDGVQYITIPVRTEDRKKAIRDVRIDHDSGWASQMIKSLRYNYRNSIYFDHYEPEIVADIEQGREYEYLLPYALFLRYRLFSFLELELKEREVLSSDLDHYDTDPDSLAQHLKADILYQEHNSRHYQRQAVGRREPEFTHPVYRQHFEGFEACCSLYDLLFQYGPESFRILDQIAPAGRESSQGSGSALSG